MSNQSNPYKIVTLQEQPELDEKFTPQKKRIWPKFMKHDIYGSKMRPRLDETFLHLQLFFLNEQNEPISAGRTIPCVWDGSLVDLPIGWGDALIRGIRDSDMGHEPNTLVGLSVSVHSEYQGQRVSYHMLQAMRSMAEKYGYQALIVPVRPSMKSHYPLIPMERYAHWKQDDGAPFDPWLRVHWRCGAEILKIANPSMVIEATLDEWTEWTGLKFPDSGEYIVPKALAPIQVDVSLNIGRYVEPNVWVHHPITTSRLRAST